jgi:ABC-type spermidine/putrescine transport system permease subunit I
LKLTSLRQSPILAWEVTPIAILLGLAVVLPVAVLGTFSFFQASAFQILYQPWLGNFERVFTDRVYAQLIRQSIAIGTTVTVVTIPLAFLLAFAASRIFMRFGRFIIAAVIASAMLSYLIRIFSWKTIFGLNGVLNDTLLALGLLNQPYDFLAHGRFVVTVALTNVLLPIAVIPIYASLEGSSSDYLAAARDLGARGMRRFWTVTVPLAKNGLALASALVFVLASSDYIAPQLLGGRRGLMVGRAIAEQYGVAGNPPLGAALSIVLVAALALSLLLVALVGRILAWPVVRNAIRRTMGHIERPAPGLRHQPAWLRTYGLYAYGGLTVLLLAFLFVPLVVVAVVSFSDSGIGMAPREGLTSQWWIQAAEDPQVRRSLLSSLSVAGVVVLLTTVVGTLAAYGLVRRSFRAKGPLLIGLALPVALPGVMIGVALLSTITILGMRPSLGTVAVAHLVFVLPFYVSIVATRFRSVGLDLENAARDLGAPRRRAVADVTIPLSLGTIFGASLLTFALSLDEAILTNFVSGVSTTLPMYIWGKMRFGVTTDVYAVATFVVVSTLAIALLGDRLTRLQGRRVRKRAN